MFLFRCEKNIRNFICSHDHFRLNETEPCRPCQRNFFTYRLYPFNCYHDYVRLNFESAKAYCISLNSTLITPKSLSERYAYKLSKESWINSEIKYVGEPFVWPDGSKIYGLKFVDNHGGNDSYLEENVLVNIHLDRFKDFNKNYNFRTICQQV